MKDKLTVTEAETLAVMLYNGGRAMAVARDWKGKHVWPDSTHVQAWNETLAGFYDIAPPGVGL